MSLPVTPRAATRLLLGLPLLLLSHVAVAQTVTPGQPAAAGGGIVAPVSPLSRPEAQDQDQDQDKDKSKTPAPPPSLPGSHAHPIPAAPPDRETADMNPTAALFDAINRGDIASARDALNRGADLNGHNVLGQTPLAMSVDLGRNDITFLLLSMRGATTEPAAPNSPPPEQVASRATPSGFAATTPHPAQPPAAAPTGTPMPEAGFLGFSDRPGAH